MQTNFHDLKTERPNVSDGLPGYYRIVPIAFYVSLLAALALSLFFSLSIKRLKAEKDEHDQLLSSAKAEELQLVGKQRQIMDQTQKAEGLAAGG
ncbi:MAG: hypothetical protein AAF226_12050, partial [Verrucomicrobiota bacterium]